MFYIDVFHKDILAFLCFSHVIRELSHLIPTITLKGSYYYYLLPPTSILGVRKQSFREVTFTYIHLSFIHSLNKYLLCPYHVPSPMPRRKVYKSESARHAHHPTPTSSTALIQA